MKKQVVRWGIVTGTHELKNFHAPEPGFYYLQGTISTKSLFDPGTEYIVMYIAPYEIFPAGIQISFAPKPNEIVDFVFPLGYLNKENEINIAGGGTWCTFNYEIYREVVD